MGLSPTPNKVRRKKEAVRKVRRDDSWNTHWAQKFCMASSSYGGGAVSGPLGAADSSDDMASAELDDDPSVSGYPYKANVPASKAYIA